MPEADIEIRHLLKSAQLARAGPRQLSIDVVLKDDQVASERYQRFFGLRQVNVFNTGLSKWIETKIDEYCGAPQSKLGAPENAPRGPGRHRGPFAQRGVR
jgi:hypothetical protein